MNLSARLSAASRTMRCLTIESQADGGRLVQSSESIPLPGPSDVVIRVAAAGVNHPDLLQLKGRYQPPPDASPRPGLEVAGEVIARGRNVTSPALGELVCALTPGGGYAEFCRAPAGCCLPAPRSMSMAEAASLPEAYFTVWFNLVMRGGLRAGMRLLVHGGSGGIGSAAIQIGRALGVEVFATAGTTRRCDFCEAMGARRAINYTSEDFVEVIARETRGRGVDQVLDFVGGSYIDRNLAVLAERGRLTCLYFMQGSRTNVDLWPLLERGITITGSLLRPQPDSTKATIASELWTRVWPLIESRLIRAVVYKTYPLCKAQDALQQLERGEHLGKLALLI